ncbi:hypothetical protein ACEPPN_019473 [Leptodophora sp. 'Broadleaf-Isolate-01']
MLLKVFAIWLAICVQLSQQWFNHTTSTPIISFLIKVEGIILVRYTDFIIRYNKLRDNTLRIIIDSDNIPYTFDHFNSRNDLTFNFDDTHNTMYQFNITAAAPFYLDLKLLHGTTAAQLIDEVIICAAATQLFYHSMPTNVRHCLEDHLHHHSSHSNPIALYLDTVCNCYYNQSFLPQLYDANN